MSPLDQGIIMDIESRLRKICRYKGRPIGHSFAFWLTQNKTRPNLYATKRKGKITVFQTYSTSHKHKSTLVVEAYDAEPVKQYAILGEAIDKLDCPI